MVKVLDGMWMAYGMRVRDAGHFGYLCFKRCRFLVFLGEPIERFALLKMEDHAHPWLELVQSWDFQQAKNEKEIKCRIGHHYILQYFVLILQDFGYTSGDGAMTLIHLFHTPFRPTICNIHKCIFSSGR